MKVLAILVFASVLCASPVMAAPLDPDDDGIGVYFGGCACIYCVPMDPGTHTGYVIVTHPTSPSLGGWEATITTEGPIVITEWTLYGQSLNLLALPQFQVGVGLPLYNPFTYPAIMVASFTFQLTSDTEPAHFYIDGIFAPSVDSGQPAYLDGSDYNIIKPLQQSTGGPDIPVATINGDCAVDTEDLTWGSVKSLYR